MMRTFPKAPFSGERFDNLPQPDDRIWWLGAEEDHNTQQRPGVLELNHARRVGAI